MLALHAFNLIFLRHPVTKLGNRITLAAGWFAIVLVVAIGPLAIQNDKSGPYFGPSGYWCWITNGYNNSQIFLEYFFVGPLPENNWC